MNQANLPGTQQLVDDVNVRRRAVPGNALRQWWRQYHACDLRRRRADARDLAINVWDTEQHDTDQK